MLPANVGATVCTRATQVLVGTPAGLATATVVGTSRALPSVPSAVSTVTESTVGVTAGSVVVSSARMRTHRSKSWP